MLIEKRLSVRRQLAAKLEQEITPLRPGACEPRLEQFANYFELELPSEFKELYSLHDGEASSGGIGLFDWYFMPLDGVDGVTTEFEHMQDVRASDAGFQVEGPIRRMYCNALWLPFAKDFGGNFIGFDLDPATGGTLGQIIVFGPDERPRVEAASLRQYLMTNVREE
jgi:cell wall assembly regulator SMI1